VGSIAAYGIGLGIMALAGSEVSLMLAAIVTGTAHGAVFPLLSSEVVNRARISERGSAMTVFTSLFDIALLLGAPTVGFLIVGFDYLVAFAAVGVILIVGAVVYGIWDRRMVAGSALVGEESLE
jgi:predicted MFS family arabinose efflux permease